MYTLVLKVPIGENKRTRDREEIYKALRALAGRIHGDIPDDELMTMWDRALSLADPVADDAYKIVRC